MNADICTYILLTWSNFLVETNKWMLWEITIIFDWFNQILLTKEFFGPMKHFIFRKKYYGWTNKNFMGSAKYLSECGESNLKNHI